MMVRYVHCPLKIPGLLSRGKQVLAMLAFKQLSQLRGSWESGSKSAALSACEGGIKGLRSQAWDSCVGVLFICCLASPQCDVA